MNWAILAYDVVSNRRRTRFYKALHKHLEPVQKSVFEGRIDARDLQKIEKLIHKHLDLDRDRVRIWFLSKATLGLTRSYGCMPEPRDPDAPIVIG